MMTDESDQTRKWEQCWYIGAIALGLLLGWGILALFTPPVVCPRDVALQVSSRNNLTQIACAIHDYHDDHKSFPPAMTVDADGRPLHGIPALLLPYLGDAERKLAPRLDLAQPFDSTANRPLMDTPIEWFLHPAVEERENTSDFHYAFNSHLFPAGQGMTFRDISDGLSHTLLAGEIADGIRPWYTPHHTRDPGLGLNGGPLTFGSPLLESQYYRGVQFVAADGSVSTISDKIDPVVLRALATPAGGEQVDFDSRRVP